MNQEGHKNPPVYERESSSVPELRSHPSMIKIQRTGMRIMMFLSAAWKKPVQYAHVTILRLNLDGTEFRTGSPLTQTEV